MARGRFWRQMFVFALAWACAQAMALVIAIYGFGFWDRAIGRETGLQLVFAFSAVFLLPIAVTCFGLAWSVVRAWPGARRPRTARRIAGASAVLAVTASNAADLASWKWKAVGDVLSPAPLLLMLLGAPACAFLLAALAARTARRGRSPGAAAPAAQQG